MVLPHSVTAVTPSTLLFTVQILPGYLGFSFMPGYSAAFTRAWLGKNLWHGCWRNDKSLSSPGSRNVWKAEWPGHWQLLCLQKVPGWESLVPSHVPDLVTALLL